MQHFKKYLPVLKKSALFSGLTDREIETVLPCIEGVIKGYKSGLEVISEGEAVLKLGIVVSGVLNIVQYDIDGNINLTGKVSGGEIFGEAFLITGCPSAVSVYADGDAEVLFLSYRKIISSCTRPSSRRRSGACQFHTQIIGNLVRLLAEKLLYARSRLEVVHKGSIRGKLIAFFDMCAANSNAEAFNLPYNRTELAEFIGANRSAMHRELKRMEDDGIIILKGKRVVYRR